jgi:hypothetical protein
MDAGNMDRTIERASTLAYTAPEKLLGLPFDEKADVYAFGIILWEIHMQRRPFRTNSSPQLFFNITSKKLRPPLDASFPPAIAMLAAHCWAPDPAQRPSFEQVLFRLESFRDVDLDVLPQPFAPETCTHVLAGTGAHSGPFGRGDTQLRQVDVEGAATGGISSELQQRRQERLRRWQSATMAAPLPDGAVAIFSTANAAPTFDTSHGYSHGTGRGCGRFWSRDRSMMVSSIGRSRNGRSRDWSREKMDKNRNRRQAESQENIGLETERFKSSDKMTWLSLEFLEAVADKIKMRDKRQQMHEGTQQEDPPPRSEAFANSGRDNDDGAQQEELAPCSEAPANSDDNDDKTQRASC